MEGGCPATKIKHSHMFQGQVYAACQEGRSNCEAHKLYSDALGRELARIKAGFLLDSRHLTVLCSMDLSSFGGGQRILYILAWIKRLIGNNEPMASAAVPIPKQIKNVQDLFMKPCIKCTRQDMAKSATKTKLTGRDGKYPYRELRQISTASLWKNKSLERAGSVAPPPNH
jgi:hypothetical protein